MLFEICFNMIVRERYRLIKIDIECTLLKWVDGYICLLFVCTWKFPQYTLENEKKVMKIHSFRK